MNFWKNLKKPIFCLAPLADVTDSAFRFIISKYSKDKSVPRSSTKGRCEVEYVTFTEFVSADGLVLAPEKGRNKLLKDLEYSEIERPIVAQLFGSNPENIRKAASLIVELGFDGLDINMGCPDKSVEKQGAGAALIKNPPLARQLIKAAKQGASRGALAKWGDESKTIPISVKTRLGYNSDELEEWLPELLAEEPAVITIHARTRKEMSKVPAHWDRVKRAVEIRDDMSRRVLDTKYKTLIFGNGDVWSVEDAFVKAKESGADGVMLGRAIFGNPFLFSSFVPKKEDKITALKEHIILFDKNLGEVKSFAVMRKHFKSYLSGMEIDKNLKEQLMKSNNIEEALLILDKMI